MTTKTEHYKQMVRYWNSQVDDPFLFRNKSQITDRILKIVQKLKCKNILEIGCGVGKDTIVIAQKNKSRITGVDISPRMIKKAKNHIKEGLEKRIGKDRKEVKKMIKAVFFDWGRTLITGFKEIDAEIEKVLEPYGLKWNEVFGAWRNFYFLHSLGRLKTDQEMFNQLRKVLNLPDSSALETIRDLQISSHIITAETVEIIREIKQQYRIGIISNNVYDWVVRVLESYQIRGLFDTIIVSSEIGARKPDARIFQVALKSVAVKPREAVFVSDELAEDLIGSKGMGMISVWLRDPNVKSEWKQREVAEEKIFEPDAIISRLEELLPFLEKINQHSKGVA